MPNPNAQIQQNHFLLFNFAKHLSQFGGNNLGDYIQTIATKNAITHYFPNAQYSFIDRDSLVSYSSRGGFTRCYAGLVCTFNSLYSK